MTTIYPTVFSDTSNLPKKEIKAIESKFPFIPPEEVKYEQCGQIVSKGDIGSNVKFCPICDFPMIVRIKNHPCEHVMCFECSQPEKGYCYICEEKIEKCNRLRDNAKLYECDYPDCFKFFDSHEKLKIHKTNAHGIIYEGGYNNMGNIPINFGGNIMGRNIIPPMNAISGMAGPYVNTMIGMGINPYMVQNGQNAQNIQPNVTNNNTNNNSINQMNLNNIINNPQN